MSCDEDVLRQLRDYLYSYCALYDSGQTAGSTLVSAALYLVWACCAFFAGFSAAGTVLIPLLSSVNGFFSMYAVSCFALAFGRSGVLVAAGALGLRLLFTLPVFFCLAAEAWPKSVDLALLSVGQGKRTSPVLYTGPYFIRVCVCFLILAVGVCSERLLTPALIRMACGTLN